jgi:hypothetical protein
VGIEFTYINFVINSGHAKVTPTSRGEETKEDFYHQSMPLPTIGLEAWRRFGDALQLEASVQGNWINRWNSLRDEGRTVWASQNGIEAICASSIPIPHGSDRLNPSLEFSFTTAASSRTRTKTAISSAGDRTGRKPASVTAFEDRRSHECSDVRLLRLI